MQGSDQRDYAIDLFRQAYARQMQGEYEEALRLYARSIQAFPTAEAYTFRGWTYSFMGIWEKAIRECLKAIEIDPEFGNPYNDIGAYLIEQGKFDEALPWFEKALRAPRYEAYCYPWFNMGRIWEKKHDWKKAARATKNPWSRIPATGRHLRPEKNQSDVELIRVPHTSRSERVG